MSDRLDALKRAEWRARMKKDGYGQCRICGGRTHAQKPYCVKHFRKLGNDADLMHAITQGERLDEADIVISLSSLYPMRRVGDFAYGIGYSMVIRRTHLANGGRWTLFKLGADNRETKMASFETVAEARDYLVRQHQETSAHNRWASKTLIRRG